MNNNLQEQLSQLNIDRNTTNDNYTQIINVITTADQNILGKYRIK